MTGHPEVDVSRWICPDRTQLACESTISRGVFRLEACVQHLYSYGLFAAARSLA